MWSSNYPAHPKFGGVKERLEIAKQELAFLSGMDQAWIFGETALSLYPSLRSSQKFVENRFVGAAKGGVQKT